ncbi:unnamed protein product [Cyprideis torosa]|uniref:Uncharacterized protein n=1 Tax=Cyprideis torosa TaxID=163714 RepID=A0A7R8W4X7_9CRUS|nr:unnamed protein product [Cyprideis torosa]CAG0884684.1 unnamed protein product [Cyprideis torosa]
MNFLGSGPDRESQNLPLRTDKLVAQFTRGRSRSRGARKTFSSRTRSKSRTRKADKSQAENPMLAQDAKMDDALHVTKESVDDSGHRSRLRMRSSSRGKKFYRSRSKKSLNQAPSDMMTKDFLIPLNSGFDTQTYSIHDNSESGRGNNQGYSSIYNLGENGTTHGIHNTDSHFSTTTQISLNSAGEDSNATTTYTLSDLG